MKLPVSALKAVVLALPIALAGCVVPDQETTSAEKPEAVKATASTKTHPMRWDHKAGSDAWTASALTALRSHGSVLPSMVPNDIDLWCPGYRTASLADREAFWVGLISALAKHESTWNQAAVGGGGLWFGLVQIAPPTARGYGCKARSGAALKNGSDDVSCAIRIMSSTVTRDGVVSQGMRGVAADWGPFHSSTKRSDMMEWTRAQPFCQATAKERRAGMLAAFKNDG